MVKLFRFIRFDHIYHHPSQLIGHQFPYRTHRSLPIFACLSFFYFLASSSRLAAAQILPCNYWVLRGVVLFGPLWLGCEWVERLRCSATAVVIFAAWLRLAAPVPGRAGGPNWKGQQCLRCIESVCPHVLCGRWFSVACVCKKLFRGKRELILWWKSHGHHLLDYLVLPTSDAKLKSRRCKKLFISKLTVSLF